MEEPKVDRKENLNVLDFRKGIWFRYPELAAMACELLSIPYKTSFNLEPAELKFEEITEDILNLDLDKDEGTW